MDVLEKTWKALEAHPHITAAGLCSTPQEYCDAGGDTDVFVYCSEIPGPEERHSLLSGIAQDYTAGDGPGRWGICDLAHVCGEEVWLMYVTEDETQCEVETILSGEMRDKQDNYYYPVGRLATIAHLTVLFDKTGFIGRMKKRVNVYPEELAQKLSAFHAQALSDTEDLERAAKRGDVLFYHFALDIALDHFLQALFAINRVYFPSRKRSIKYIEGFEIKPKGCAKTLLKIIKLGSVTDGIEASFMLVKQLIGWTISEISGLQVS